MDVYKAALSATLPPIDGVTVGNHPIIIDLFKGFTNLRPREYKESPKWSVDNVLQKISNWGSNESLKSKLLVMKLALLIGLSSAGRSSELSYLSINFMHWHPRGVEFSLLRHKKNRKSATLPGKLFISEYKDNPLLCPISCLKVYLKRTEHLQRDNGELFLGTIKPFNPVSPATISRWLTKIIRLTGEEFGSKTTIGHEVRANAASKAANLGLSTEEVLAAGEWRSNSVFQKFYFTKNHVKFGTTVLEPFGR